MKPSRERFMKERFEHEDRYYTVYETYTPDYKSDVVTGKFYSKYDAMDLSLADPVMVNLIKTVRDKGPKEKYPWPVTENQMYGWFPPLFPIDRTDRRFYHALKSSEITKHEMRIRQDNSMKIKRFTGIPFKL